VSCWKREGCNVKISLNLFDIFGKSNENQGFLAVLQALWKFRARQRKRLQPPLYLWPGRYILAIEDYFLREESGT
jgi:hypothetical protein